MLIGFVLGLLTADPGAALFTGLLWAGGTVLGGIVGSMVYTALSKIALFRRGSEKTLGQPGARLIGFFFVLGALATWTLLYFNL